MKNSKIIFLLSLFLFVIASNFISAVEVDLNYSTSSILQLRTLKYEPYPVNPGEYFDFWVGVQYIQSTGITFELDPGYPFSLDSNESTTRQYSSVSPSIVLHYKVRVDKDAVEGTNKLTLNYKIGDTWYSEDFDIEIENSQTDFDAVIQEMSSSDVSIAIANIGKYAANSVVVRIPEQDSFTATGTDGQMVGNLASGDYTIVSFSLSKKMSSSPPLRDGTENFQQNISKTTSNLKFDIYYTDNIGVRRVANMELPLNMNGNSSSMSMSGNFPGRRKSWSIWYTLLIIAGVMVIIFFILFKKFPKQTKEFLKKLNPKKLFKKKDHYVTEDNIPDWIKNANAESEKGKRKK